MATPAIITTTTILMDDEGALIRLLSWLSPAFPIGGFAYSGGLETLIADGAVEDAEETGAWIRGQMRSGAIRLDAVFLALAHRAMREGDAESLAAANALALALQSAAEREAETREQARSFLLAAGAWQGPMPPGAEGTMTLPIAFGALAGLHGIPALPAIAGYANAVVGQQISVAVRLVPIGQTQGLKLLAGLEPDVADLARAAVAARLEDVATLGYGADIAAMRHEHLTTRIFRS